MPIADLIAIFGGPAAAIIVGLTWYVVRLIKRQDELVDRYIEMNKTTSNALNDLARQIEASLRGRE